MHQAMFPTPLPETGDGLPRIKSASASVRNTAAFEDAEISACEDMAERLEQLADDMGRWSPGSGMIHRINNMRMLLLGEAHRLRRMIGRVRERNCGRASMTATSEKTA